MPNLPPLGRSFLKDPVDTSVNACMHVGAVQFAMPAVTLSFDSDSKAAAAARAKACVDAAEHGYRVGATHWSFPGLGKLRAADGGAYVFVPANYRAAP